MRNLSFNLANVALGFAVALSLFSQQSAAAKRADSLSEMKYERQGLKHEYSISKNRFTTKSKSGLPNKPTYTLVFKENKRPARRVQLSRNEAEFYTNSMNRLIWSSEYLRKPASTVSTAACKEYVRIKMQGDQTRICQENKRLTGESYGLLKQLRAKFSN